MEKLHIISVILTVDNNPTIWTEADLASLTSRHVVVGYILKPIRARLNPQPMLNLYVIKDRYSILDPDQIISLKTLANVFLQWIESLREDPNSYMFRNPPLNIWLETKANWVKKITGKLSLSYSKTYDECLSVLYTTILKCYNKNDVYIGNLQYIITSVNNQLKVDHRFMRNRLTGEHVNAVHLDASLSDFNDGLEDSISSLHEIIGGQDDPYLKEIDTCQMMSDIRADLMKEFSPREIDQIVNAPGYLPNTLYRKLLKWRKTHKREDYL